MKFFKNISKSSFLFFIIGLGLLALTFINNPGFFDFQSVEKSRTLYRIAREYQKNGEYKNAFYSYAKISSGYSAYDAVLFYQAKCAAELQDEKTAILKLKKLLSSYSDSPLAPQASYNLGQAYIRTKNYSEAQNQFIEIIKKYPKTDYAVGSFYYLGEINKDNNKAEAAKYWLKYLEIAPSGRFAMECYEGLKNLSYKLSDMQKKEMGVSLFIAENYSKSLFYLKQIPLKYSWYYIAKNYEELGDKNKELYFYKEGLRKSSFACEKRENFEQAMQEYALSNPQGIEKGWDDVLSFSATARDFALFQKARFLPKNNALKYYMEIIKKYPNGDFASESLWNVFWNSYLNNKDNYEFAIKLGENHISKYENTKASPAIYFWMGKIYEKRDEKSKAFQFYQTILSKYPDSYYAFRADGRIIALKTGIDPGWKTNLSNKIPDNLAEVKLPYSDSEIIYRYGASVLELIKVKDYDTILSFLKDDAFLESWIDLQNGIISKSIVVARNEMDKLLRKPDFNNSKWNLVYPVYYSENINQNAELNRLDPAIVISLMKEESYFNTFALSYSNARGLMQLLPGTAVDIARWKRLGSFSSIQLFDPDVNIKLGTAYLSHVKNKLHNSMLFAVAAYNGGPAAVERWNNSNSSGDLDEFIENIPYEQTKTYVKKVYKTYWNYKRIYNLK